MCFKGLKLLLSNHTDEIFGTHSPPICGCDWLAGDGDWTTISIAKAPMTGAEVGNEVIQIDYNAEVQKGAPLGNWP